MTYTETAFQRDLRTGKTTAKTEAEYRHKPVNAGEKIQALVAYCDRSFAPIAAQYIADLKQEERVKIADKLGAIASSGEYRGKAIGTEVRSVLQSLVKDLTL